jgi:hypothetical protein
MMPVLVMIAAARYLAFSAVHLAAVRWRMLRVFCTGMLSTRCCRTGLRFLPAACCAAFGCPQVPSLTKGVRPCLHHRTLPRCAFDTRGIATPSCRYMQPPCCATLVAPTGRSADCAVVLPAEQNVRFSRRLSRRHPLSTRTSERGTQRLCRTCKACSLGPLHLTRTWRAGTC